MKRLLFLFLFFLSSCDKGSDLNIEEAGLLETAEIYLLNNLGHLPGFCLDVAEEWPDGRAPMQSAGAQNMNVDLDKPLQAHSCHSLRASNALGATGYGGVSATVCTYIKLQRFTLFFWDFRTDTFELLCTRHPKSKPSIPFVLLLAFDSLC